VVRALGRGALAETVARLPLDDVLTTGRRDVEARVAAAAQAAADRVGIGAKVEAVQLASVAVPAPVQAAFLDVISAEEHKRGLVNSAEAYAAQVVPKARGEASAVAERAAGDAAARAAAAAGKAAWVEGVSRGGSVAPGVTHSRIWRERVSSTLATHPLVLAPGSVRVWLGGEAVDPKAPPARVAKPAPKADAPPGGSHG
jgi:membrane protease subunit HflK